MKRDQLEALLRGVTQTDLDYCEACHQKSYVARLKKEYLTSIQKGGALYCDACHKLMVPFQDLDESMTCSLCLHTFYRI